MKSRNIGKGRNQSSHNIQKNKTGVGRDQAKLNRFQKEELITKIIDWLCEDTHKARTKEKVLFHSPVLLSDDDATKLIRLAQDRMQEITKQSMELMVNIHLDWYEEIYQYFNSIDNANGVNKVLRMKERLLGLLKSKITVNETKKTVIIRNVEYDLSKFTDEQRKRFEELINKAK